MKSVGQQLRDARMRRGVSLEEVSATTRITVKNLQAIENDELSGMGSPFFYRSFVRQFAECVQMEYAALANAVQTAADSMPQPLMPGQAVPDWLKVPPLRARRSKSRWFSSFGSLVVMLAACSTFYAMWQSSKSNWENAGASLRSLVKARSDGSFHGPRVSGQGAARASQPAPQVIEHPPEAIPTVAESAFRIELSAIEPTWLSIVADGKRTFSGILGRTQTKVLEGHDIARIHTGNAGGVTVVFNGKAIGTLGLRGQVLTAVFTKDRYEIVGPSEHMALIRFTPNAE